MRTDVELMAEFLRALGWVESSESEPVHRLFHGANGPRADGFRGFTLGLNLATAEEVDRVYEKLQTIDGAELLEEPSELAARVPRLQPPRPRGEHVGRGLETRLDRHSGRRSDLVLGRLPTRLHWAPTRCGVV